MARNRKISHQKFERDGSIVMDPNMHRSVRKKYSGQNLQINQSINDRYFLKSKRTTKKDPAEIKNMARDTMKKGKF